MKKCDIFGHVMPDGYCNGLPYLEVRKTAIDGIGREHADITYECERCKKKVVLCHIHLPETRRQNARIDELTRRINDLKEEIEQVRAECEEGLKWKEAAGEHQVLVLDLRNRLKITQECFEGAKFEITNLKQQIEAAQRTADYYRKYAYGQLNPDEP